MERGANLKPYQFRPGQGGRPKGAVSGRARVVQELDRFLKKEGNIERLRRDWQELFDKNPTGFVQKVVLPFIPREMIVKLMGGDDRGGGLTFQINQVTREVVIEDGKVVQVTELPADAEGTADDRPDLQREQWERA